MIKMVIFDLDGTLVNTLGGIANACNHVIKQHGYDSKPTDEYNNYVGNGLAMTIYRALPDKEKRAILLSSSNKASKDTAFEKNASKNIDSMDLEGEPDFDHPKLKLLVHELLEYYKLNPTKDSFLYDGIEDVLNFLDENKIQWGIHTNKLATIAKDVADTFIDPRRYLGLKGPGEDIPRKPDPKGTLDLIKVANEVKLDEVIYIGDTEVDIKTAENMGIPVIAVSYGFRKKEKLEQFKPDYLVDNALNIIDIIKEINHNK